jgi:hypothetical protein
LRHSSADRAGGWNSRLEKLYAFLTSARQIERLITPPRNLLCFLAIMKECLAPPDEQILARAILFFPEFVNIADFGLRAVT